MSLKPCKECGHEVAASAETCPNCGVKKPAPSSAASALIWPVIIVIGIVAVVAMQKDGDEKTDAQQTDTAPSQPQSVRETPEEPASPWQVTSYRSPVDDSTNVHVTTRALVPVQNRFDKWITPTLSIDCRENTTMAYIAWDLYIGMREAVVLYRIDKQDAVTREWSVSTGRDATGLWRGATAIPFVKALLGNDTLFVRTQPYGRDAISTRFNIEGLADAIKPLRESCHW